MARTKTIFLGTEESGTDQIKLNCFLTQGNEIYLSIEQEEFAKRFICLDRSTAIRLVKVLKSEIAQMEVDNG